MCEITFTWNTNKKMTIMKTTRKRIEQKKMHGKSNLDEFPEKRFL